MSQGKDPLPFQNYGLLRVFSPFHTIRKKLKHITKALWHHKIKENYMVGANKAILVVSKFGCSLFFSNKFVFWVFFSN